VVTWSGRGALAKGVRSVWSVLVINGQREMKIEPKDAVSENNRVVYRRCPRPHPRCVRPLATMWNLSLIK
jgi:hypothetical protein